MQMFQNPYQPRTRALNQNLYRLPSLMGDEEDGSEDQLGPSDLTSIAPPAAAPAPPPAAPPQDEASRYFDAIQKIRGVKGPATTDYEKMIAQGAPQASDYNPSKGRRIGAILAGIAGGFGGARQGIEAADNIVTAPYRQAVSDYSNQLNIKRAGAAQESQDTNENIKDLSEARAMGLKYDEFELKKREARQKQTKEEGELKIAQDRAKAYIAKMGQADYDMSPQQDGSVLMINKHDPSDRKIVPASTVASFDSKSRRISANAAAESAAAATTNAETGQTNAITARAVGASLINYRNKVLEIRDKQGKIVQPTQQNAAIQGALELLGADARFKDFVLPDGNSGFLKLKTDDGSPLYREFMEALKKKAEAAIKNGTYFQGSDSGASQDEVVFDPSTLTGRRR